MTNATTQTNDNARNRESYLPTHIAKVRHGQGKTASYEQIGVAWVNEKGGIYVKLHGTQIVSAFSLYEVGKKEEPAE